MIHLYNVALALRLQQNCNTEIDKEKEIDKEINIE